MKQAVRSLLFVLVGLSAWTSASLAGGATIVVDAAGGGDFTDLQSALDRARDGDTVLVRPGRYESSTPLDLNRLYAPADAAGPAFKNLTLRAVGGPEVTTISLSGPPTRRSAASVLVFKSGESPRTVVEGFTLSVESSGSEIATDEGRIFFVGAGILCLNGSRPTIQNCRIERSRPNAGEGLVYAREASPTLIGCTIAGGSGVVLVRSAAALIDCEIIDHIAPAVTCRDGSAPLVAGCTLARSRGGLDSSGSFPRLIDCSVLSNSEDDGGVAVRDQSDVLLERCVILANYADDSGGGVVCAGASSATLIGCLIAGNAADGTAGAIGCAADSPVTLINCTVAGNLQDRGSAVFLGDGSRVVNSIFAENRTFLPDSAQVLDFGRGTTVRFSCLEEAFPGEGNIVAEAGFLRSGGFSWFGLGVELVDAGDYRLRADSPCRDAGSPVDAPAVDLNGNQRPCGAGVDLGAFESGDCPIDVRFLRGDANDDGFVGITDAVFTLSFLFRGATEPPCVKAADANDNGTVELTDAVSALNYLFLGAPPPPAPFGACGGDPTPDRLTCTSPACP